MKKMRNAGKKRLLDVWSFLMVMAALVLVPAESARAQEPEKPNELETRETKHHEFKVNTVTESFGYNITNQNSMIMPGDTFEFPVYYDDSRKFYYSLGYWGQSGEDMTENAYRVDYAGLNEGDFDLSSGKVVVTGTQQISYTGASTITYTVPVQFKNNSKYPITVGLNMSGSGGSDPYSHNTRGLVITYYQPYYKISYGIGSHSTELEDMFWQMGEYSTLDFPQYYWITDTPYTIRIPNPVSEGYHFNYWSGVSKGYYVNKGAYTDVTVCWNPDAGANFQQYYDLSISPIFENGSTITFYGNGGLVNDRDKWVLEVSKDDTDSENPKYNFSLDTSSGSVIANKEEDTFLGWCSKESALYNFVVSDNYDENHHISGSFVTKDSAAEAYEALSLSESGSMSSNWGKGILYAKWDSETHEKLEKNGYDILEDGTLWLLNNYGVRAWTDARNADANLAATITDIKTGYKDETVSDIADGFENCTGLVELTLKNLKLECSFKGCTNLKEINLDPGTNVHYTDALRYNQFEDTSLDLVINVPEDKLEYYRSYFPEYAYLFNADSTNKRYPLTVNGKIVSSDKLTIQCGGGTAVFDPETSTLTLDNAELSETINLHNAAAHYYDEDNNYINYNSAVIVSNLPKLKIVLKGDNILKYTYKNGTDYDAVRAYGDLEITGDGKLETQITATNYFTLDDEGNSVPYTGVYKLPVTALGDTTIDGITATKLSISPAGALVINDARLDGGLFTSAKSINITQTVFARNTDWGGPNTTEDTKISVSGGLAAIEGSTFDEVVVDAYGADTVTIRNSNITLRSPYPSTVTLNAGENTNLNIINSNVTAYGQSGGVTNIPESNITLTDCAITSGSWSGSGSFVIKAGEEIETPNVTYKVTFNTTGGSSVASRMVVKGSAVSKPSDPTREGYTFDGWYSDSAFTNKFSFSTKITANITLYAKWTEAAGIGGGDDNGGVSGGSGDSGNGTGGSGDGGNGTGGTESGSTTGNSGDNGQGGTTGGSSDNGGNADNSGSDDKTPTVGTTEENTSGTATYKVTDTSTDSKGNTVVEVAYVAPTTSEKKKTTITVPATVTLADGTVAEVTEIAANAFKNNKKVTKVTVGKNVEKIGAGAFLGCTRLKTVNIGSKVTSIGNNTFAKCTSLTRLTIPATVVSIGKTAFNGDKKLKTITIKSRKLTSKSVSKNAFKGISTKTTIEVPKSKKKAYTTLFRKKGLSKKVKIKS